MLRVRNRDDSSVSGGIHFRFDQEAGAEQGRQLVRTSTGTVSGTREVVPVALAVPIEHRLRQAGVANATATVGVVEEIASHPETG